MGKKPGCEGLQLSKLEKDPLDFQATKEMLYASERELKIRTAINDIFLTVPEGATIKLLTLDRGAGAGISSAVAPNTVYYAPIPEHGTYLQISSDGYKSKIVRLDPDEEEIHVELVQLTKEHQCRGNISLSRAFASDGQLPDISFVANAKIPGLIDQALAQGPASEIECSDGERTRSSALTIHTFN